MKIICDGITIVGKPHEIEQWIKLYPSETIRKQIRLTESGIKTNQ